MKRGSNVFQATTQNIEQPVRLQKFQSDARAGRGQADMADADLCIGMKMERVREEGKEKKDGLGERKQYKRM